MQVTKDPRKIRNVAIIAHVDHGKTTLVDGLLKQSNTFRDNQAEMAQDLIMDSGDQERERGITITAKITAVEHNGYRINIIDTPGHADFGGEVERTLNMADGCLLIVDAQEGPMPQTKFVLTKALALNLKPIVVINKIDKPGSRIQEVEDELADLFLELAVHEDQLHYPIYYAIGREGKAWKSLPDSPENAGDLNDIFDGIINDVPAPTVEPDLPFQMLVTALSWDSFQGKYAVGRISRGAVKAGDQVVVCKKDGSFSKAKVDRIYNHQGLAKIETQDAIAGDIVSITGLGDVQIGETIADPEKPEALPVLEVEAPTLKIYLGPNTSPFKGKEADFSTSRQISDRLNKELETNIGLQVEQDGIGFLVSGRGELHLGVLIETMRREGFEFEVGRPQVVTQEKDGKTMEPLEEVIIEVGAEQVGAVQAELGKRRAELKEQFTTNKGVTKLIYEMPTRTLLGLRNTLMTATKGTAVMNSLIIGYQELGTTLEQQRNGVLIAFQTGTTTPYALQTVEERGTCFVGPAVQVYAGQIIGLNTRGDDMEINVAKEKHLTNMRSSSSDGVVQLTPPVIFSLEQCLDFLENDELLEVTPKSLRLRKRELDPNKRKRQKY
ncbi:translational GTPase TypA [Candidatus Saccharibacteria bacterium]|nr:MAG: translational GTPase TypA [Candidatus Saccharibacteria bacterium]